MNGINFVMTLVSSILCKIPAVTVSLKLDRYLLQLSIKDGESLSLPLLPPMLCLVKIFSLFAVITTYADSKIKPPTRTPLKPSMVINSHLVLTVTPTQDFS